CGSALVETYAGTQPSESSTPFAHRVPHDLSSRDGRAIIATFLGRPTGTTGPGKVRGPCLDRRGGARTFRLSPVETAHSLGRVVNRGNSTSERSEPWGFRIC